MGWSLDDVEGHEGYAAYVTRDGRTAGSSNGCGVLIRRPDADEAAQAAWSQNRTPTTEDLYELIPWADVTGWEATCACGWRGTRWDRTATTLDSEYPDAESAGLLNGSSVEDAAAVEWQAHAQPLQQLTAVRDAAAAYAAARDALGRAVCAARSTDPPPSWADIGRATGMTWQQLAHERWSD